LMESWEMSGGASLKNNQTLMTGTHTSNFSNS